MTNTEKLIEAAQAFLGAYGGDIPDWLQDEADALDTAITAAKDAPQAEAEDDEVDDGERTECGGCGESYNESESDANDPGTYCSEGCEDDDAGEDES